MNCIFGCSNQVTAVSPELNAAKKNETTTEKVAQTHQIIRDSIPGSLHTHSPLLDQPVILSPLKLPSEFSPIPTENEVIHHQLPPNSSTRTTPDDEVKTPDDELDDFCSERVSTCSSDRISVSSSEDPFNTPNPTPRSTPLDSITPWSITPPLAPADFEDEIDELSLESETVGRSLRDQQLHAPEPENLEHSPQTTLGHLILLNSLGRKVYN